MLSLWFTSYSTTRHQELALATTTEVGLVGVVGKNGYVPRDGDVELAIRAAAEVGPGTVAGKEVDVDCEVLGSDVG